MQVQPRFLSLIFFFWSGALAQCFILTLTQRALQPMRVFLPPVLTSFAGLGRHPQPRPTPVWVASSSSFSKLPQTLHHTVHRLSSRPTKQALTNFSWLGKNFDSEHSEPACPGIQVRLTMGGLAGREAHSKVMNGLEGAFGGPPGCVRAGSPGGCSLVGS